MVVVLRTSGLRFVIYRDDHEPPHVHAFGDAETKVELGSDLQSHRIIYADRVKSSERRRVERAIRDNHALLLARWEELRG